MSLLAGLEKPIIEFKGEGELEDMEIEFNFGQLDEFLNKPTDEDE